MRTFADKYDWLPIDTAPWEVDVTLLVTDGRGEPYRIPYPCKLTAAGWVNSPKGLLLEVTPMNWKPYLPAKSGPSPRHPWRFRFGSPAPPG